MWVYDLFTIITIWIGIFTPYPVPLARVVCPCYNVALGERLGIHQDPASPPPCFVMDVQKGIANGK